MALHKGGSDFPAFKDLFYLLVEQCQMPSCGLRMVRGQERDQVQTGKGLTHKPVSIFAVMDMGSKALHTPLGPILPKVTCN